ncbi:MAG: hypothetical protein HZT40_18280 [Candidatus Thiothrix singaporensis]|uniref:Uncharacterized protein n=1 Tax=Candidatus Thiothrix singaporensis TaxID=2799669 RepID=A0A7L6AVL9_9GAMM|nr:MAG: hypothetical protein HZT40_18280 [Candidatus Thiothrix singaporensis]
MENTTSTDWMNPSENGKNAGKTPVFGVFQFGRVLAAIPPRIILNNGVSTRLLFNQNEAMK